MTEPVVISDPSPPASDYHPEEMRAAVNLRIGERAVLQAQARMTPAGVISGGLALSAMFLSLGYLARSYRRLR